MTDRRTGYDKESAFDIRIRSLGYVIAREKQKPERHIMILEPRIGLPAVISAILLSACTVNGGGNGIDAGAPRASAPVAAQVAVFNRLFADNASSLKQDASTYCVDAGSQESTRQVAAALRDNAKVKPASACDIAAGGNGVFDRQTRQRALMFRTTPASCSSASECLIRGGYYEGNVSAQTNLYRVSLVGGHWSVTMEEMGPIS